MITAIALLLSLTFFHRFQDISAVELSCLIPNEERIQCQWTKQGRPALNYTFHSKFKSKHSPDYTECPLYLQEEGYNVGCMLPYKSDMKFNPLYTRLLAENKSMVLEVTINLQGLVLLNPPDNLTLEFSNTSGLWLYWNFTSKPGCVESEVRYRNNKDTDWQISKPISGASPYNMAFPDEKKLYTFQVRSRIAHHCGSSDYWSEWSIPLSWGSNRTANTGSILSLLQKVLYPILGCALLVTLAVLLVHNERLRVILVPIAPNPLKNLEDLLNEYNGNVEEWLHIPKDIIFRSNFTETACPVREYHSLPSGSYGGSECSLPILMDDSDCFSTSSASSSSTLPAPPYDAPPPSLG
uniref:Cytokine receptor common subunit gamma-like n=1 Tax=Lepisosteus oculatus TaxID=7918 RepID=W5NCJ4_LEPOC